jgi:glycyl-tRNA synthetase
MFRTNVGPVEESASVAYLRPETAQGIFVNFANVATTARKKLPFGIAQIGRLSQQITGQLHLRDREFEQMDGVLRPSLAGGRPVRLLGRGALRWWTDVGIGADQLRLHRTTPTSCRTTAPGHRYQYEFDRLVGARGVADRTDYT